MFNDSGGDASSSGLPSAAAISVAKYFGSGMRPVASASESEAVRGQPRCSVDDEEDARMLGDYWEEFDGGVVRYHCEERVT